MNGKKLKTPEKIVNATINCIERYGFNALTVRMIADAAEVNIAAVNYHFHSKENLVEQVKNISFNHMIEDLKEINMTPGKSAREIMREMCKYILEGASKFPEITRMHFYEAFIHGNFDTNSGRTLNKLLFDIAENISKNNEIEREILNISLHRLFSTLFFNSIFQGVFNEFTGYSLKDEDAREAFLDNMVNTLPF
ncbi:MAG: TetR/AcrR family transcriptional regulator [Candidatus Marinimicrobia bacterium]|nr:TetR/AcrR family transcriptional regulator [Candidatus Neomarinimicrobiota bacterium]